MAATSAAENQARLRRPHVTSTNAAKSGPEGRPAVPAHPEQRLGLPVPPAGHEAGHP
jgi:hypothetical protein